MTSANLKKNVSDISAFESAWKQSSAADTRCLGKKKKCQKEVKTFVYNVSQRQR